MTTLLHVKCIVGQTAVSVGRMAPSRPAATRGSVAAATTATRVWTSAATRRGAAVSYAAPRTPR